MAEHTVVTLAAARRLRHLLDAADRVVLADRS